jgi:N-acetylglucosamine-6-sulfatase
MKNFNSNLLSSILLTAPLLQSLTIDAEPKSGRPNIIFVLVDDLRWDAMGFTGKYPFLKTPNIDHLRA